MVEILDVLDDALNLILQFMIEILNCLNWLQML